MEQLKLSNQICFPFYAISRLIIRAYQPYLDKLNLTYPQYLVLMVLWETEGITVNEIAQKLILNTNTVTPLLKRMETQELITRNRSDVDERKVVIHLTNKGKDLQFAAADIPEALVKNLNKQDADLQKWIDLKPQLDAMMAMLNVEGEI